MAEMWTRSPIMQGNTEQHQLTLISQLCGSIMPEVRAGAAQRWCGQGLGLSSALGSGCCMFLALEGVCCRQGCWESSSCKLCLPPGS